jgi:hypothetical protein
MLDSIMALAAECQAEPPSMLNGSVGATQWLLENSMLYSIERKHATQGRVTLLCMGQGEPTINKWTGKCAVSHHCSF